MNKCYFCGSTKITLYYIDYKDYHGKAYEHYAKCDVCKARGPVAPTKEMTTILWNSFLTKRKETDLEK